MVYNALWDNFKSNKSLQGKCTDKSRQSENTNILVEVSHVILQGWQQLGHILVILKNNNNDKVQTLLIAIMQNLS